MDTIINILLDMIYCFAATLFFALIMNAPKKTLIHSSLIGSIGYMVFEFFIINGHSTSAFFFGTTVIATLGEIYARRLKMPATIFIFPAVIPIVPGLGLYETILAFVREDTYLGLETGAATIFKICSMAVAMAIVSLLALKIRGNQVKN